MKKIILIMILGLIALIPGDSSGFVRTSHPAPRPAPRPAPIHTPAFVAPRPAPVYHPPARVEPRVVAPIVRPNVAPAFRPAVVNNRPVIVNNRPAVGFANHPIAVNRPAYVNRGIYVNRNNGYYRPGYAYYHNYYAGWHHGYWPGWYHRPWLDFGLGVGVGWLLAPGQTAIYTNPYWVQPVGVPVVYNYAQPIPIPQDVPVPDDSSQDGVNAYSPPPSDASQDPNAPAAQKLVDDARQAFYARNYNGALQLIDQAVSLTPKDTTVHEFRALTLFALHRYQDATATIYGVLAVAPGWDWDTMRSFYPDTQTYTDQLRALEDYARKNPNDAASRFLLAYQYLVCNQRDAAVNMLRRVGQLQPSDQLSAHILQMLTTNPGAGAPTPGM